MTQGRRRFAFLTLAAPLLVNLAACGGGGGSAGGADSADPPEIRTALEPTGGSAAEGSVRMTLEDGNYTVVVTIDAHRGPGDYPVHIHEGSCAEGGSVTVPLTSIEGQEGGEGQARTNIAAADLPGPGPYFVQLHDAQDQTAIACGDLPPL